MKTIVLTGPECTGKSTLARELANEFGTVYVPETAREYAEIHKGHSVEKRYTFEEIEQLARAHQAEIEKQKKNVRYFLFVDTHLIIFKVWFLWAHGHCPEWIDRELKEHPCNLYLLCAPDIPWTYDSARQHGGAYRQRLFRHYREELDHYGLYWRLVRGTGEKRIECVKVHLEQFAAE